MDLNTHTIAVLFISLLLQLSGMAYILFIDSYIGRKNRRIMVINTLVVTVIVLGDLLGTWYEAEAMVTCRLINSVILYALRPVVIVLFIQILEEDRGPWILVALNAVVQMTAFFSGIVFMITPDNHFLRGPLGYFGHVVSAVLLMWYAFKALEKYSQDKNRVTIFPFFMLVVIIAAIISDTYLFRYYVFSMLTPVMVVVSVFNYMWLHLQFVREHEDDLMAQERIKIMMSQLHPHFIYNSLTVIEAYLDEPEKAEEALEHFTGFLRGSIDLLESGSCIQASQELRTVENYLYLEKERFGDKLNIVYDIGNTDFELPAFAIQTLVENAVSHGIRKNKGGVGTLVLRIYDRDGAHVIEVEDDGRGFDVAVLDDSRNNPDIYDRDGHAHIGLKNLRSRLAFMCGGELDIDSRPGRGTVAVIRIPGSHIL